MKILVVDDVDFNRKLPVTILRLVGQETVEAADGPTALRMVEQDADISQVLLDVNMPEMNGFELCEALKNEPTLADVPVIFISALSDTADKVRAFTSGGVDYVTKPFQFDEVHARVRAHLQIRAQQRALQVAHVQLQELESHRDSLVHMVVHDMRSLLSATIGNLEWLSGSELPTDATEAIADALNSGQELREMVHSLLDISRMETSELTLCPTTVDLSAVAASVVHGLQPLRGERTLSTAAASGPCGAVCDLTLIRRVIQNLVGNALKFTHPVKGVVGVEIRRLGARTQVRVADNGQGIPTQFHGKIFDKFFQVEARQHGVKHASGLGLTFCKLAVEAHGGRIGVESEPGQGATFWFDLPAVG